MAKNGSISWLDSIEKQKGAMFVTDGQTDRRNQRQKLLGYARRSKRRWYRAQPPPVAHNINSNSILMILSPVGHFS